MKPLALLALLVLFACGQAVDQTADDDLQPDSDPATSADDGNQATRSTTTRASTPRPLPEATAPEWRTCQADDDCELRDSVCAPLTAGGLVLVCRRERAQAGEECSGDSACEPGLTCDEAAGTCRPFDLRGETDDRKPLSCEPDGSTVDAHCEAVD